MVDCEIKFSISEQKFPKLAIVLGLLICATPRPEASEQAANLKRSHLAFSVRHDMKRVMVSRVDG